jgi:hypothetical protein
MTLTRKGNTLALIQLYFELTNFEALIKLLGEKGRNGRDSNYYSR